MIPRAWIADPDKHLASLPNLLQALLARLEHIKTNTPFDWPLDSRFERVLFRLGFCLSWGAPEKAIPKDCISILPSSGRVVLARFHVTHDPIEYKKTRFRPLKPFETAPVDGGPRPTWTLLDEYKLWRSKTPDEWMEIYLGEFDWPFGPHEWVDKKPRLRLPEFVWLKQAVDVPKDDDLHRHWVLLEARARVTKFEALPDEERRAQFPSEWRVSRPPGMVCTALALPERKTPKHVKPVEVDEKAPRQPQSKGETRPKIPRGLLYPRHRGITCECMDPDNTKPRCHFFGWDAALYVPVEYSGILSRITKGATPGLFLTTSRRRKRRVFQGRVLLDDCHLPLLRGEIFLQRVAENEGEFLSRHRYEFLRDERIVTQIYPRWRAAIMGVRLETPLASSATGLVFGVHDAPPCIALLLTRPQHLKHDARWILATYAAQTLARDADDDMVPTPPSAVWEATRRRAVQAYQGDASRLDRARKSIETTVKNARKQARAMPCKTVAGRGLCPFVTHGASTREALKTHVKTRYPSVVRDIEDIVGPMGDKRPAWGCHCLSVELGADATAPVLRTIHEAAMRLKQSEPESEIAADVGEKRPCETTEQPPSGEKRHKTGSVDAVGSKRPRAVCDPS
jgi:hypothetical protein